MHLTTTFLAPIFLFFTTAKAAPFKSFTEEPPATDGRLVVDVEFEPFVDAGDSFGVIVGATFLANELQQITNQILTTTLVRSANVIGRNGKNKGESCDFFSDANGQTSIGIRVDDRGFVFNDGNFGANILSYFCSSPPEVEEGDGEEQGGEEEIDE